MCEARTRNGGQCARPAGWGTKHPGWGTCKLHGGSTQSATKAAARRAAVHEAEALAHITQAPADIAPEEALLQTLRSSAALTSMAHLLLQGAIAGGDKEDIDARQRAYEKALERQHEFAANCVKLGIEQRQVEMIERLGDQFLAVMRGVLDELDIPMEKAQPIIEAKLIAIG